MTMPRSATGANTAERVPSTTRAAPLTHWRQAASRSASVRPECSTATGHREALAKSRHELRRESDLRHQHQRAPLVPQAVLDGVQVHLGLAAAGNAVQQEGCELSGGGVDGGHGGGLLGAECRPGSCAAAAPSSASGVSSGTCAEDTKPRATSARIGVRQSSNLSRQRFARRCRARSRRSSSSSRWRRRAIQARLPSSAVDTRRAREPAFGERAGGGAVARQLGQRGGQHLAERSGGSTARRIRPVP